MASAAQWRGVGKLRVEPPQRLDEHGRDREVPHPVAVGRDHVPGRPLRRGRGESLLVGGRELAVAAVRLLVVRVVLPALGRIGEPLGEPLALLLGRDVQEALEHRRAFLDEQPLELDDPLRAPPPHLLGREPENSHRDDVLVVRAVEDPDHPACRALGVDAPEEVVRELDRRGRLERRDATALRVDTREDVADRPVLAGGVEALEDEEDAPLSLGVEALLQRRELLEQRGELLLRLVLPRQAERVARVTPLQVRGGAGIDNERWTASAQPTPGAAELDSTPKLVSEPP